MPRLRVLLVGQGPPTRGGIPTFVGALLEDAWLRERVDFEHLNTTPGAAKRPAALTGSNLRLTFVHAWAVFRRGRRADVVHLNLAPAPTLPLVRALALSMAARASGSRVILHAHTGRMHLAARSSSYRLLLWLTLRAVHAFVVVSGSAQAVAGRLGRSVVQLDNGIDPDLFAAGPKSEDPPLILFVGTVCERKGLLDLRDALVRLKRDGAAFPVEIIGDAAQEGPGVFEGVRAAYAAAGLEDVRFLGEVDGQRVRDRLAAAAIFCLPSHWEGFPLSLLEAMAASAAPVAAGVGDVPRMLANGEAGVLVEPRDVDGLAEAIGRLAGSREERGRLGTAARARVAREYSQERLVNQLYDLYVGRPLGKAHSR
jgi:glycosyltransferase involved in cell wall biosynthesis